jgi:hypothetical protein
MRLDFKKKPRNRRSHVYFKIALAVVLVGALLFYGDCSFLRRLQ